MDNINQEDIEDICFNVSQNIILPKFKNLSDNEINYKNGTDLVTAADIEAEKELKKNLLKILPSSNFIGEEEYSIRGQQIPLVNFWVDKDGKFVKYNTLENNIITRKAPGSSGF